VAPIGVEEQPSRHRSVELTVDVVPGESDITGRVRERSLSTLRPTGGRWLIGLVWSQNAPASIG
jgi:hypothetical protein